MTWIAGGPIGSARPCAATTGMCDRSPQCAKGVLCAKVAEGAPFVPLPPRHDSTPPGSWLRERYEKHRQQRHPVEDAFDPGPAALMRPLAATLLQYPARTRDQLFRRLDEMLGRKDALAGLTPPVSDYVPQMAREFYDDGA